MIKNRCLPFASLFSSFEFQNIYELFNFSPNFTQCKETVVIDGFKLAVNTCSYLWATEKKSIMVQWSALKKKIDNIYVF